MSSSYCVQAFVSGRVQGVFFRKFTAEKARSLGLAGHAENLSDGRVAVIAAGEKSAVHALIEWLQSGSPLAQVRDVQWQECESPVHLTGKFTTG
ncbi:MAG: acylphosphatase [Gammaproteobacteria bacterium]|nr:acylphosphatase [Gammaproteobacteria bacterium]